MVVWDFATIHCSTLSGEDGDEWRTYEKGYDAADGMILQVELDGLYSIETLQR